MPSLELRVQRGSIPGAPKAVESFEVFISIKKPNAFPITIRQGGKVKVETTVTGVGPKESKLRQNSADVE